MNILFCFLITLKLNDIKPIHKKRTQKKIKDLSVFHRIFKNFMKSLCLTRCLSTLVLYSRNFSVDLEKAIVLDIGYCQFQNSRNQLSTRRKRLTVLIDLLKLFDFLSHDLSTAKLNAYGFSFQALRFPQEYLSNCK